MQHAKHESAQEGTDDSDDQITDDSLAFPLCDQACEPAGHQTNQQEPNNIHQHTSSLPVCGGVLRLVFWCQDRIAAVLKCLATTKGTIALSYSRSRNRQGCANALGEIRGVVGSLRGLIDPRTPAQLVKRQDVVDQSCAIDIAIDEAVQKMTDIKSADPASGVRVAHDVDRATVAQQVVKLWVISKFVDSIQVH